MLTAKTLLNFDNPIFHKIVKKLGFGLGTAYRFGFCQKFEKKPWTGQNWAHKILYMIFQAHF